MTEPERKIFESFSPLQRQIAVALLDGDSHLQIAEQLGVSGGVVLGQLHEIRNKVDTTTTTGAALFIARRPALEAALKEATGKSLLAASEKRLLGVLNIRQKWILYELMRGGPTNRDIARELGTTEQCIKNELGETFDLTGTSSRVELVLLLAYSPNLLNAIEKAVKGKKGTPK